MQRLFLPRLDAQEIQDKPPNKNAHCSILKFAGGIPVAAGLVVALLATLYLWITKTKNVEQLSNAEMVSSVPANPISLCFVIALHPSP